MATIRKVKRKKGIRWCVEVRICGVYKSGTFDTKAEAQAWAAETEAAIRRGRRVQGGTPAIPFETAIKAYLAKVTAQKKPSTQRLEYNCAKRLMEYFSGLRLDEIRPATVAAYRDERLKRAGGSLVRSELALLSHLYRVAAAEWGISVNNPVMRIKRPAPNRGRMRLLTQEEAAALLEACRKSRNRRLYYYILLLMHTGMRPSEAARLKWEQVDLENQRITLTDTKTEEIRIVPMTQTATRALAAYQKKGLSPRGDYVFLRAGQASQPVPSYAFKDAFALAVKRAGISHCRLYDLRHTAASHLLMAGVDVRTLAEILGHRTMQMVMRYTHLLDEHKRKAISALDGLGGKANET